MSALFKLLSSQILMKTLSEDSQTQVKTNRLILKVQCSFQLEISDFFTFLNAILTFLDPDPDPYYQ